MMLMGVSNKPGGRRASIRELTPMFRRPPDAVWAQCFRIGCEQSPVIDWCEAGFAKCEIGGETAVIDALGAMTAYADALFIDYLRRTRPEVASDVVAAEMISDVSVGDDGPYLLPVGPPTRLY